MPLVAHHHFRLGKEFVLHGQKLICNGRQTDRRPQPHDGRFLGRCLSGRCFRLAPRVDCGARRGLLCKELPNCFGDLRAQKRHEHHTDGCAGWRGRLAAGQQHGGQNVQGGCAGPVMGVGDDAVDTRRRYSVERRMTLHGKTLGLQQKPQGVSQDRFAHGDEDRRGLAHVKAGQRETDARPCFAFDLRGGRRPCAGSTGSPGAAGQFQGLTAPRRGAPWSMINDCGA